MRHPLLALLLLIAAHAILSTSNAAPDWVDASKYEDKAFFIHALAPRVEVYNLHEQDWETPIPLTTIPSALKVDDTYLYIAYGKDLYRYLKDGTGETYIAKLSNNVKSIETDGDLLFVDYSNNYINVECYDRTTLDRIDAFTSTSYRWSHPFEIETETNKLSARDVNGRYVCLDYDSSGQMSAQTSSSYFPNNVGERLFQWPSSERLIGQSGYVFDTQNLMMIAQLEGDIDQVEFAEEVIPIIRTGSEIIAYSRSYRETGRVTLEQSRMSIFVHQGSESVFAFYPSDESEHGISAKIIPYQTLKVEDPYAPINPATLEFTPEDKLIDQNGVLYLLHSTLKVLFRWDSTTQAWKENLVLKSSPTTVEFSSSQNRVYLGYKSGEITYFDTASDNPTETLFKNVSEPVGLIVATGDFIFVDQYGRSTQTFHVYDANGSEIDSQDHGSRDQKAIWNETTRRIIYTSQGYYTQVYSGGIDTEGKLSEETFTYSGLSGEQSPLYSNPSDGIFITSAGHICETAVYGVVASLPNPIMGAAWIEGKLHTVQNGSVKNWEQTTYEVNATTYSFDQKPLGLIATPDEKMLLITQAESGQIRIKKLDANYNLVSPPTLAKPTLELDKLVATAARLQWPHISGATSYTIERSSDNGSTWQTVTTITDEESTTYVDIDLSPDAIYHYRIQAKNGASLSDFSDPIKVNTTIAASELRPLEIQDIKGSLRWAESDDFGILYMVYQQTAAIFRYDLNQQAWIQSIPLQAIPSSIHLSKTRKAILVGYDDGSISYVSLASSNINEIPFSKLPDQIRFISSNSKYIVVSEYRTQHVFDNVGVKYSSANLFYSDVLEPFWWDEISQQFYWKDYNVFAASIDENHQLKSKGSVITAYSYSILIAENFANTLLLTSDKSIYSVNTGGGLLQLDDYVTSGTWVGKNLFTSYDKTIRKFSATTYAVEKTRTANTRIARILSGPNNTIVTITEGIKPTIELLSTDLSIAPPDSLATPSKPALADPTQSRTSLYWADIGGEKAYIVERRKGSSDWLKIAELPANSSSFEDTSATPNESYDYRIKAVNGDLESSYSEIFTIAQNPPGTAGNLQAETTENKRIKLSWLEASDAYGYSVMRSNDGRYWSKLTTLAPNQLNWIDDNSFYQGNLYFYRVDTVGSYGRTTPSETVVSGIDYNKPSSPNLYLSSSSFNSIRIAINKGSNTENIRIERSLETDPQEWIEIATLPSSSNTYTDPGLHHSTAYRYRAIGINPNGESSPSEELKTATTTLLPPDAPYFTLGQTKDDQVQIYFSTASTTEKIYIYRKSFLENESNLITELSNKRIYVDENVEKGKGYSYYALAENQSGKSAPSTEQVIRIEEGSVLFEEDFQNDVQSTRFTSLEGRIEKESTNRFLVPNRNYTCRVIPNARLSNGGTLAFSIKYILDDSNSAGEIRVQVIPRGGPIYNLFNITTYGMPNPGDWNRFYIDIPNHIVNDDAEIRIILDANGFSDTIPMQLDDIVLTENLLLPPAKPTAVVAKQTSEGDTAVFWLPSPEARYFLVESSVDDAASWTEIAQVDSPTNFYNNVGVLSNGIQYRVSAVNRGGKSEPSFSERVESDYDLSSATEAGINKVLNAPTDYSLHTTEELELARITAITEVKSFPDRFGLFAEEKISHLYYKISNEWVPLKNDLLSVTWSLYQSSNLVDWTKHTAEISFELEAEEAAKFIKISPNTEPTGTDGPN